MVDLESDTPYFYWTFDRFADLDQKRDEYGFEHSAWKSDLIASYSIGEAYLTFDSPKEWGDLAPVRFHRTSDGRYEHHSEAVSYDAVRADTESHVVLTGRWTEPDFGKGVFIAVFPIKQDTEAITEPLLETAAMLPVESYA